MAFPIEKPRLSIDFDGVIHDNSDGAPFDPVVIPGPTVDGAIDWLYDVGRVFSLAIFTARGGETDSQLAVVTWLAEHGFFGIPYVVTSEKLPSVAYVDDRGWQFGGPGTFPSIEELFAFRPWNVPDDDPLPGDADPDGDLSSNIVASAVRVEPYLSLVVQQAVTGAGGFLAGFQDRLKPEGSVDEKLYRTGETDVKDAVRYTAVFDDDDYTRGTRVTLTGLAANGLTLDRLRNYWPTNADPDGAGHPGTYVGINTVLATKDAYRFEVQFHTPGSLDDQERNWESYRRLRDGEVSGDEADAVAERMRATALLVPRPPGAEKLSPAVLTAASRPPRPNRVSGLDAHNAALRAAQKRVDELEGELADLLVPILEAAGSKAASSFRSRAPVGLVAALTAAGPGVSENSTMVALKPRPAEAEALALSAPIPAETLHVTLAYLGEIDGPLDAIADALRPIAGEHAPLVGEVAGGGFFGHPDGNGPTILLPDVPGLVELRVAISEALVAAKIPYSRDHGFQAHVTIAYRGEPQGAFPPEVNYRPTTDSAFACATCERFDGTSGTDRGVCVMFDAYANRGMVCDEWTDEPYDPIGDELHFDAILVVRGDTEIIEIPLVGMPPMTAASNWAPPGGDEVVDVDELVKQLRTKTDPVRLALLEAAMKPGLEASGLSFDVTNPFTAKVLSQAGSNVRNIAETTQLNVMRTIRAAYQSGLSVPDTAKAIQAGMSAAAPARATMIARTELAGAVNGGSLAATRIVSDATGDAYDKIWLTAPGAPHPRHELYDGLDGQRAPLDGYFDVGGSSLQYPGDPDGDPGESINCRCTMVYDTPSGEVAGGGEDSPPSLDAVDGGSLAVSGPPAGDTVSVSTGPFVPASLVSRIDSLGLNRSLSDLSPTTDVGQSVYAAAPDTEGLYKTAGEWSPDRRALHEDIIAKHFEGKVATGDTPTAYFTSGGGASGKSSMLFDVGGQDVGLKDLGDRADVVHIDPDRIKAMLPEYTKLRDAGDLYAASGVHEESSALAKAITVEAQRRGLSTIIDTTGSGNGFVQKLEAAKAAGYDVKVSMVSIPTNEAIVRSMARGDRSGRYVALQALKKAHSGASKQLAIWQNSSFISDWRVYDNSGATQELVAEGGAGGVPVVFDSEKWDAILAKANEKTGA